MKSSLLFLFLVVLKFNTFGQVNLQLGLNAYYPLDNTTADAGPNGLYLTVSGSPAAVADRFGHPNGAYRFSSAVPDYLFRFSDPLLNPGELSVSAWVNLFDPVENQKIVSTASVNNGGYILGVQYGQLYPEIWDSNGVAYSFFAGTILPGIWTHLMLTFKASDYMRGYVNGVIVDSIPTGSVGIGHSPFSFTISTVAWDHTAFGVDGSLEDIFIYGRAVNRDEVVALYQSLTSDINETQTFPGLTLCPVPVSDKLTIDFKKNVSEDVSVRLFDQLGKEMLTTQRYLNGSCEMDVSNYAAGVYCVLIDDGNRHESRRIVVGK